MQTIVVGYDASDAAERALARAAELAEALSARLVVVSVAGLEGLATAGVEGVAPPLPMSGPLSIGGTIPVPDAAAESTAELEEHARRRLERARATLAGRGLEADYVARVGEPAETLLDVADERDAELLVVGSREHGFVERLLARPVEEAVARRAERDVLLVH
jgi:nucleotide-binding universal stress UspA family protein